MGTKPTPARDRLPINELTRTIIDCAYTVHKTLGPGLLEEVYEQCLCREFSYRGIRFEKQVAVPVEYRDVRLACGYRLDLLVEGQVIVELKCVDAILAVHRAQLLTYLKLTRKPVGLLINFNVPLLKQGLMRLVNNL